MTGALDSLRAGRLDPLLVALLGALVFLPGLSAHDLWNPDEPRYADVARTMLEGGSWLVPQLNGGVYSEKPPLLFWCVAALSKARGGVDELTARLPSALAGVATLVLVFGIGRRAFGRAAAFIAVLVTASTMLVAWKGHVGQIDMLLTALVLGAVSSWHREWSSGGGDARRWWIPWALCGLATLAKGPVGLLVPMLGIAVFLLLERDARGLRALRAGRGLLVWAVVVGAWLVPALLAGGGTYFDEIVVRQNVTRYANPWGHLQPWYYFLTTIPVDFLPWTIFLPAIVAGCAAERRPERRATIRFLATWIAVAVVFFSLSPGKRGVYVLAVYPSLALLAAAAFDRFAQAPDAGGAGAKRLPRAWLIVPGLAAASAFVALAGAAAPVLGNEEAVRPLGRLFPALVAVALAPLALGALAAALLAIARRPRAMACAMAAGMLLTTGMTFTAVLPRVDRVKSARPLSEILDAYSRPGEAVGIHPRLDPAFLFYADRHFETLRDEAALRAFCDREARVWLLAERDDLAHLDVPLPLVEVARDDDLLEGYILLTSPPWPVGP